MASITILDTASEADGLATLTLAFSCDPVMRWAMPGGPQYLSGFPRFVQAVAGKAFDCGTAYGADELAAVALWLPPGEHVDAEAGRVLGEVIRPGDLANVFALFRQTGAYHPAEPHWYLPFIGVDCALQGRGYGSALLTRALADCDAQGTPAYLESSNERNVPLYERFGFRVMAKLQWGDSPCLWPMLREARRQPG